MEFSKKRRQIYLVLCLFMILGTGQAEEPHLRIPPEWELHSRTLMVWPATPSIWGSASFLEKVRNDIARIAVAVATFEPVTLIVDPSQISSAKAAFNSSDLAEENGGQKGRISLLPLPVDDLWARDTLPIFGISTLPPDGATPEDADPTAKKPHLVGIDLNFNGWGNKQDHDKDGPLANEFLTHSNITRLTSKLVAEGGSLEFDGEGTLLLTESSVFNTNRNPDYSTRDEIESELKTLFKLEKVIWFKGVKGQDITDAHVDCVVRFVSPGVVLLNRPFKGATEADVWSKSSDEAKSVLATAKDARGRAFRVIEIFEPDPDKIVMVKGRENTFVASYVNYLVVNGGVIIPQFGDKEADEEAKKVIGKAYPGRRIVSVVITHLASGGGGIHCSTHDIPSLDGVTGKKGGAGRPRLF